LASVILNIDGRTVETETGRTVLQAALEAGVYIPHLCYHPNLKPEGACRLCIVEIEGRSGLPTSCNTPVENGMAVKTKTEKIIHMRRLAMELLLVNHPADCSTCPKYLNCELQSLKQFTGVSEGNRFKRRPRAFPMNASNPLFVHDFSRCVLCGRCVRACNDFRGIGVLSFISRGNDTYVGTAFDRSLADSGCKFCGACAEVCPTGSIRDQDYVLKSGKGRKTNMVPCRYTCPAEIDVPRYVRFIHQKNYPAALAVIREKAPFPLTLGYVCNHVCETACRRSKVNAAIAIKELKRFAAEKDNLMWEPNVRKEAPSGKKVAVIGSGPAGLTAAYYLAKLGHGVTVLEALPVPGGMLRVGIPEYRLPLEVLNAEIKQIEKMGVEIKTNTRVESPEALLKEGYDAVLVAIGTHKGVRLPIPGNDLDGVLVSTSFLKDIRFGKEVKVGQRVVVLGGGSVAFDCARTAVRLGAREVTVACLEPTDKMLAAAEEITCGQEEGITTHNSQSFSKITGENGRVTGVECQDVSCFEFDDEGALNVECVENSAHIYPADTVIFAVGQRPEIPEKFDLPTGRGNTIQIDEYSYSTEKEGIFAAGDAVTGASSVIQAIALARKAAAAMDSFLGGSGMIDDELAPVTETQNCLGPGEGFAAMPRGATACIPVEQRNFKTAEPGYDEETALKESSRCLQCDLRLKMAQVKFWADFSP
jgi:formate dehydrogenase (NADP+) beta subunit